MPSRKTYPLWHIPCKQPDVLSNDASREVVLIAEDNPTVQDVIKAILASDGYNVLTASDGLDAWKMAQRYGRNISIVVTDVDMPRMNGVELAKRLKMTNPGLPVLMISGSWTPEIEEQLGPTARFLEKPFDSRTLLGIVRAGVEQHWGCIVGKSRNRIPRSSSSAG